MNRILLEERVDGSLLNPSDKRFEHVRGVLRMKVGDTFDVGVMNGPVGKARIVNLDTRGMEVEISWGDVPPPPPDISLIIGMCRPATVRKILTTVPTIGAARLVFTPTGRSDPAYARSSLWREGEWRERLIEGVEQAFDTHLPEVDQPDNLEEAISSLPESGERLVLDVYEGSLPIGDILLSQDTPLVLAVGPERGWNRHDRDLFRKHGFTLVSMGSRVMRVETAVVAGLTLLHAKRGLL